MKSQVTKLLVLLLLVGLAFSTPVRAQVSGATLNGLVTDAQGGAVAGAKISAKNAGTGTTAETTTNDSGAYTLPNLNPADYEVSVTATGFKTTVSKVSLAVGAKQAMNFEMVVGEVAQTVEVTAAAPQVDLTSSTISDEVTATTVRELPLNGRDWASLAQLQPSVVEARTHLDVTHVGGGGGRGFGDQLSIGGGRPTQNSYRLDGAIVNDYSNAGPGSVLGKNLGVDAIQEFTVLTSNYSAEYGFTSGGVINAITKSGTNSFHGVAFDFLRNDKLDAANFFANANNLPKDTLRQNQFGAAGGYKVLKDKVWLFADYEGVRKAAGTPVINCGAAPCTTISDAVRSGIVTNLTTGAVINLPAGTVNGVAAFAPTPIDPSIVKYLPLFPHPTGAVVNANAARVPYTGHQGAREDFLTARGDYKISNNDTFFGTYLRDTSNFNSALALNDVQQGFTSYRHALILEETHVFNTSFTNTVRGALDRTNNFGGNSPTVNNPLAGDATLGQLPGFFSSGIALTSSLVTSLPGGKNYAASVQDFWGQIMQVYDDAFVSHGDHSFKLGFSFLAQQVDGYTPLGGGNGAGTFSYRGLYNVVGGLQTATPIEQAVCLKPGKTAPGNTLSDYDQSCGTLVNFLTDNALTATRPVDLSSVFKHYLRDKVFGVYFQDDWRFKSNLTLNLGLRYEMSTIPTEKYGKLGIMPTPTTPLPCSPTPSSVPPIDQSCSATNPASILSNVFFTHNPTLKNFEPRIGFAWDPFKDGKTSVRGGFGIFDALPLAYELILNNNSAAPFRPTFAPLGPGSGGLQNSPAQGQFPFQIPTLTSLHVINPSSRSWQFVERAPHRNYVYQYSFNVQRQLTPTLSILVGYSGTHALHNPFQADSINTVIPTKDATSGAYYWPTTYVPGLPANAPGSTVPGGCPAVPVTQNCFLLNPTTSNIMYNTLYQSRSWYNGLQVKVEKRMGHGFQLQGSYTWSKSIDDSSGSTAGDTFQLDSVSEPWYDQRLNKGLSDFDVRHNLVINGLWNVPSTKSLGMFGDKVLGGWQLGIIMVTASGIPEGAIAGQDLAGEVIQTVQPPNLVSGCSPQGLVNANYRHTLSYINASCLGLVPLTSANAAICDKSGTGGVSRIAGFCPNIRGNLGRDTIVGPGLFNMDFSVFKNNYIRKISETFNVQFRAEMFNVLNHTNFAPSSALSLFSNTSGSVDPGFGVLTSTQNPDRQIQLALKLVW